MLSINISELIWTIINFFLLYFLLKHFLYKPVIRFLDARQARLDAALEEENKARAALEENRERIEGEKAAAVSSARRPVRLQQRGPPISAFLSRHCAVNLCGMAHSSGVMGEAPLTMLAKMPAPAAAPQTPRNPHEPPAIFCPRFQASRRAAGRSSSPPQLR